MTIEDIETNILTTLNHYADEFQQLVKQYAAADHYCGEQYCEFFIDPASFITGCWHISAVNEYDEISGFAEFNWQEILETQNSERLNIALNVGYGWLLEQLKIANKNIDFIELKLFHNGSLEYEDLT